MKNKMKIVAGALVFLAAGQAWAATSWSLTSASVESGAYVYTAADGTKVTATGWANTAESSKSGTDSTQLQQQLATGTTATNFERYSGGLGINNRDGCTPVYQATTCTGDLGDVRSDAPEHAIDNEQRYEMVLLKFSQLTQLTSVKFGWTGTSDYRDSNNVSGDSDFTILAYTGSGTPSLSGLTWSTLGSDWTTIGNYAGTSTSTTNGVSTNKYSSYWLVGAYNPLAGGTNSLLDTGNDYMKLASVSGNVCVGGSCTTTTQKVPEPGSLALFGVALLGLFGLRRRQRLA